VATVAATTATAAVGIAAWLKRETDEGEFQ